MNQCSSINDIDRHVHIELAGNRWGFMTTITSTRPSCSGKGSVPCSIEPLPEHQLHHQIAVLEKRIAGQAKHIRDLEAIITKKNERIREPERRLAVGQVKKPEPVVLRWYDRLTTSVLATNPDPIQEHVAAAFENGNWVVFLPNEGNITTAGVERIAQGTSPNIASAKLAAARAYAAEAKRKFGVEVEIREVSK